MVRTIIRPDKTDIHLSIPQEYVGKEIEITYMSLDELKEKPLSKKNLSELAGSLSHETAEAMLKYIEESRSEWSHRTEMK